ncbi:hypothetical protein BpHYR1_009614 [Brachionus plicatilis]|uniref:Uncharacterized protein n=1 Tax=Brachionus plicatilis TaxID=10195 RepID=A0A3M7T5F9_BRAPC|nr:hypothetical protein BpHYR1_009614 [Brachionus plicatilis]
MIKQINKIYKSELGLDLRLMAFKQLWYKYTRFGRFQQVNKIIISMNTTRVIKHHVGEEKLRK